MIFFPLTYHIVVGFQQSVCWCLLVELEGEMQFYPFSLFKDKQTLLGIEIIEIDVCATEK